MKIEFYEFKEDIKFLNSSPKPALKYIPEWFKKAPLFCDEKEKVKNCPFTNSSAPNTTYKNCTPFTDALTTGYIFEAPMDIQFKLVENGAIEWNARLHKGTGAGVGEIISLHSFAQYPNLPNLNEAHNKPLVFKWQTGYSIKTPKGYSTLYTRPFNRFDLPFEVFTGVVDTDKYHNEVLFPFQLTYKFKGIGDVLIVEKGTPVCQILPFKRDAWKSSIIPYNEDLYKSRKYSYLTKIVNAYKSRYWTKKLYD